MKLILFDIDGTLIKQNGIGRKAMRRTLEALVGSGEAIDQVNMAGMCDWGIWREVLGIEGYSRDMVDAELSDFFRQYVEELAAILDDENETQPEVLPGVPELLEALSARDDVLLGLLTGNVEAAAWLKLGKLGIDRYFAFGAFGSESADRSDLPALAVERAARFANGHHFSKKNVVIIGDTVHDIRCGEALGACAVGVATGSTGAAALREAGADFVWDSLMEYQAVFDALVGNSQANHEVRNDTI